MVFKLSFVLCFSVLIIYANSRSINQPSVCKLQPEIGLCFASQTRYYFNIQTGNCETFTYGGCQGNGNNFETQEECQSFCSPTESLRLKRSTEETEQTDVETADQVSVPDTTKSEDIILDLVQTEQSISTEVVNLINTTEIPVPPKNRDDICFQPFAEGTCKENLIRYYYDPEVNKCTKFIFKGCFQYDNNFENLEDCESLCVLPDSQSR